VYVGQNIGALDSAYSMSIITHSITH